jgi:hypothetical protein
MGEHDMAQCRRGNRGDKACGVVVGEMAMPRKNPCFDRLRALTVCAEHREVVI